MLSNNASDVFQDTMEVYKYQIRPVDWVGWNMVSVSYDQFEALKLSRGCFTQTGALTSTGAEVHRAFLRIESLLLEDAGPYRCRVDFKQAPTRNVKFRLDLIGDLPT